MSSKSRESEFFAKEQLSADVDILGKVMLLPCVSRYYVNSNLAIELLERQEDDGEEWYEPFCTLTVNTSEQFAEDEAAIDVNNMPWAEKFIKENDIGSFTGRYVSSGFCRYPVYRFDNEFLRYYEYPREEGNDGK